MNMLSRTTRSIAVALIGLTSLAVLGGCAVGGVSAVSSNATITPATPTNPSTPTTPVTPATPVTPTFESDLTGVALNTVTNRFYVADAAGNGGPGTGEVLVFDATTNLQIDTVTAGAFPVGIAVNPVTNMIYVVCINSQNLLVIDGATDKVVATLSVGTNPVAVAVNPATNKVYVADGVGEDSSAGVSLGSPNLMVVNGATNTVVSQVSLPGLDPVGLAINTKTNTVYIATEVGLSVVNGANDTVTANLGSTSTDATDPNFYGAFDVAVDESINTVYVANESTTNGLTVINGATNTVTESIPLYLLNASGVSVGSPARMLAVNPTTHMVYITMETEDMTQNKYVFSVFNGATSTVLGTVGLDSRAMGIAVSPVTGLVYTVESQEVGVINVTTKGTTGISVP